MTLGRRGVTWLAIASVLVAAMLAAFYAVRLAQHMEVAIIATGGSPEAGRAAIVRHACGACHEIAGIPRAEGRVGPPLTGVAARRYLGGQLPNTPENMTRWIQDPQAFAPGTAMPDLDVTEEEARDIAAYLYRLR